MVMILNDMHEMKFEDATYHVFLIRKRTDTRAERSERVEWNTQRANGNFKVVKFDGTGNFGLWQTRVKDLLAQQGILKALRPQKLANMDEEDWEELQQRAA
ncbi:UNVERIFIED_CONTAM: hypothetical protein Slati_1165900 [Sesamum latifolium]|uniref:Uncharacterized protein n=1 Tax=Sesamum latifolium TaxID=2727402 RepID=A0AAW2XDU3_9LAMI